MLLVHVLIGYITILLKLSLQELSPLRNRQLLVLIFKELTDFISSLAGLDKIEPVAARSKGIGIGDDFHLIPSLQLGIERHHAAINLGSCRLLPNLGMDLIGKINGS